MVFPIHSKSVLGLVCCLVNENSVNCTTGLVLLCFFFNFALPFDHVFVLRKSQFSRLTSDLIHSLFQLNGF